MNDPVAEAARRRTFAIISHPDAGKTTLTEKFLLYGGALTSEAGSVKARSGRRSATSDWMALEQQRGISITSTVLQFPYHDHVVNLLDTPGHRDFSEDTYRVLAAADAAVMVLDAAKGIEPQTLKLFDVCRQRGLPLLTLHQQVGPARPRAARPARRDREADRARPRRRSPGRWASPATSAASSTGAAASSSASPGWPGGATEAPEELVDADRAATEEGAAWTAAADDIELLDGTVADLDPKAFLAGEADPGVLRLGADQLRRAQAARRRRSSWSPRPSPREDVDGVPRSLDAPFSGFVFKVQANMDPSHRDRIAFLRVCSGRFERGMVVTHEATGKPFATKYAHQVFGQDRETIEEAYPGDVVGLVNATDVKVGDTLFVDEPVRFPAIPSFAPEHFSVIRVRDTGRFKQFRRGIAQLDEEGVVQVLRDADVGDQAPILAAVGPMQFEVAVHRLENEFGAPVELSPTSYRLARRTDAAGAEALKGMRGVRVVHRADGTTLALFESQYWVERLEQEQPDLLLERLVAEGSVG